MKSSKKVICGILTTLMSLMMTFSFGACLNGILQSDSATSGVNSQEETIVWTMETVYAKAQELGYQGTLEEFRESIRGKDGVGIKDITLTQDGWLIVILSDDTRIELGQIVAESGKDGIGIVGANVDEKGNLILMLSNGENINCGLVKGQDGNSGVDGVGIENIQVNNKGELIVQYTDGTEKNLGVAIGTNGQDGINGVEGKDGVGIKTIVINEESEMVIVLSNDIVLNLGKVVGENGENGKDGDSVSEATINEEGELVLLFVSGKEVVVGNVAGKDGIGVQTVLINEKGELVVTLTSGTELNLGNVVGVNGKDGIGIAKSEINQVGELVLTYTNGDFVNLGRVVGTNGTNGADGVGIASVMLTEDGELVIELTNRTIINLGNIKGKDGANGQDGDSISEAKVNDKGELILTFESGKEIVVGKVVGADGSNGENGKDGVGVGSVVINNKGELIVILTNGTELNLGNVVGANGNDGIGISKSEINENGELVLTYTNGNSVNLGKVAGSNGLNGESGKDGVGIGSVVLSETGNLIVELTNGTRIDLGLVKGQDGDSVSNARINDRGELVLSFDTGKEIVVGNVVGANGQDGVGIADVTLEDGKMLVTLTNNTVIDLGNIKGQDGTDGVSIVKSEINEKGELVLFYSNSVSTNLGVIVGDNGVDGKDGVGIANVTIDDEGYLSVTLTSGVTLNLGNIKGPQGDQGDSGLDGVSVVDAEINADGELIFTLSNNETLNVGKIIGKNGQDGINGIDGIGIKAISFNANGELIITLTDDSKINCGRVPTCNHSYSEWRSIIEPTCTSVGIEERTCTICLYADYKYIKQLDHNYNAIVVEASCAFDGYTKYVCSSCKHTYFDEYTSATEHNFTEAYTLISTCEERKILCICSNCGSSIVNKEDPIVDHAYGEWVIEYSSTCTTDGFKYRICANNNAHIETQIILATGHIIAINEGKAATCLKKGCTEGQYCLACNEILVEQKTIAKLGHEFTSWYETIPSTETTKGEKRRDCIRCDEFEVAELPLLDHSYVVVAVVEPTCVEYGYTLYKCNDCEDTYKDHFTGKIEHDLVASIEGLTCTQDGYTKYTCKECNYSYIGEYLFAKGHKYDAWYVNIPSTCEENGEQIAFCCYCGEKITRRSEPTGHLYILTESLENQGQENVYQCEYCGDIISLETESGNIYIEETKQLLDQESSFSFTVIASNGIDDVYNNLTIIDAYFDDTEYETHEDVIQKYNAVPSSDVENGWVIYPVSPYESGTTYIAKLDGDLKFADYPTQKLVFSITIEAREEAVLSSNIIFLKEKELEDPGYYPYTLKAEEDSDYLYLTLSKVGDIKIGDILLIGDVTNAEEFFTCGEETYFGKVEVIYMNEYEEYVCVLSCPELNEIFAQLDISSESYVNFEEYPEVQEALERESLAYLYDSEEFAKFLVATEQTVQTYAVERNLKATNMTKANFSDMLKIEKPKASINGSKVTLSFGGTFKNEFKDSKEKKLGEFSIDFTIKMEIEFKVSVNYKIKYKWKIIPTGLESFDLRITQQDKFSIDFNVKFSLDYELEEEPPQYYYHKENLKIHIATCTYKEMTKPNNIVYIDAKELSTYASKEGFSACLKCQPVDHLNRAAFVINTHKTTGGGQPYTIHCCDCWHVEEQMNPENMELFYGSYDLLVTKLKLQRQQYEKCSWCKPHEKETLDFEESLLQTYKYADWGTKVSEIKEWVKTSGASEYKDAEGIKICSFNYPIYVLTLNLDLRVVLTFKFEAALNYHYEQTHTNVYGMRLQSGKVKAYSETSQSESSSSLKMSGSVDFRVGLRADGNISFVGLSKWIRAGIYIEAGAYIEAKGILYITNEPGIENYKAAYFSRGLYVEASCYYKLFKLDGDLTLLDKTAPFATYGYDKAYYSYTKELDVMEINANTALDLKTLLAVKYYDVQKGTSVDEVLELDSKLYKVSISLASGKYCRIVNGQIIVNSNAPCKFTDTLVIKVTGNTTWKNYVKGSAIVYLDTRTVAIVYQGNGQHSYKLIGVQDPTCTELGYKTYYCSVCDTTMTEDIQPAHKSVVDAAVAPTCTETGLTIGSHCSVCQEVFIAQEVVLALGHKESNWIIDIAATCTKEGAKHIECTVCHVVLDEDIIEELGHDKVSHPGKAPTCTNNGWYAYETCTRCAYTTYKEIEKLDHDKIACKAKDPTCTEIGWYAYEMCTRCTYTTYQERAALGHAEVVDKAVPPTCTETGLTEGWHCVICEEVLIAQEVVEANGHTEVIDRAVDPTCMKTGLTEGSHCSACQEVFVAQEILPLIDHIYEDEICIMCEKLDGSEGLAYTLNSDGVSYSVTGIGTCTDAEVIIPSKYERLPVTLIGDSAFYNCSSLTSITVPDSVMFIERYAFAYCSNLTSLIIGEGVTSIDNSAFAYSGLISISIPDNVTSLGDYLFRACRSLASVDIGKGVMSLGDYVFKNCSSLASITVSVENTKYQSIDGNLYAKDTKSLVQYAIGKTDSQFIIPDGVISIYMEAFRDCASLTSVEIPDSVIRIGTAAFQNCSSLKNVTISKNITDIDMNVFRDCSGLTNVVIPDRVTSISSSSFNGCSGLTSVTIPDSVNWIGEATFANCSNLTNVVISSSVRSIGKSAFYNCNSLSRVYYKGTAEEWGQITIDSNNNTPLTDATRYYYSETEPNRNAEGNAYDGKYWHYDENGEINIWDEEDLASQGLAYTLNSDGVSYSVTGIGTCSDTVLFIPATYEGLPVTSIGDYAFDNCSSLTSVVILDGVTSIGWYAFQNCRNLKSVTIPDSVTVLNPHAFLDCRGLTSVLIGNGVTSIVGFLNCSSLTHIVIPDSVTSIGHSAFLGCSSLTSVIIPDSVTSIADYAFKDCSRLASVVIGDGVTLIGSYAFSGCANLTSITIPDSVTSMWGYVFAGCDKLTSVTLSRSITLINDAMFLGCSSLTSITIPSGVRSIGSSAFSGCTRLTSINIPNSVTLLDGYVFSWCGSLTSVVIPNSVTSLGEYAFRCCYSLTSVAIPDSVTSIGSNAFQNCSSLMNITVGDGNENYQSIDGNLYTKDGKLLIQYACGKTEKVFVIPDGVTSIGGSAFYDCSSLTSVDIPDSVTSIGSEVFYDCSNLSNVSIPNSVTAIGGAAFHGCSSLTSVAIPDGVIAIATSTFASCRSLMSVVIPDSVTSIGANAFINCDSLTSIVIPNSVSSIGNYAFKNCSGLTSVVIPDSVTSIGMCAFSYCDSLTKVVIGDNVTKLESSMFEYCSSLTSVVIGDSVTLISGCVFYGCSSLTSVVIPDTVITVVGSAFGLCDSLSSVYYKGTAEEWDQISINSNSTSLTNATRYYYSETEPALNTDGTAYAGNYWYYDKKGEINVWDEEELTKTEVYSVGLDYTLNSDKQSYSVTGIGYCTDTGIIIPATYQGLPVTAIAEYAFYECENLITVEIPENVTTIGTGAFYYCVNLMWVELPDSIVSIASYAFNECFALKSVVFGDSLTYIASCAFYNCRGLITVDISNSVTCIDGAAFYGCTSLTYVYYEGTEAEWNSITIVSDNDPLLNATRYYYND